MQSDVNLINLMSSWPKGAVFTSSWLIHDKGYTKGQLQRYSRSGWIELLGKGAYRRVERDPRTGDRIPLHWTGGVYALQALETSPVKGEPAVLVSALTALEFQGYAHYLNQAEKETVWLFVIPTYHVPTWFKNYDWKAKIKLYSPKLFSKPMPETLSGKDHGAFVTIMSGPERAMMEFLELCPQSQSLDHAKLIMEGLTTLRPNIVTTLLRNCNSIKVKRLFLALADLCGHQWLEGVDLKKIDLGTGSRVLESGQGFHSKYRISVPKSDTGST